jgi:CHASE2 domain-containing sensor protein
LNSEFLYYIKKSSIDYINKNLIVVEIDDLTYSKLGFPLERKDYVPFLNNISKTSPAVV